MHLLLLGLILVVCILVYYLMTTGSSSEQKKKRKDSQRSKVSENLRKEDNVIFLPTADDSGSGDPEHGPDSDDAE